MRTDAGLTYFYNDQGYVLGRTYHVGGGTNRRSYSPNGASWPTLPWWINHAGEMQRSPRRHISAAQAAAIFGVEVHEVIR